MVSGRGTPNGPDLSDLGRHLTVHDLEESLDNPPSRAGKRSSASCPGWAWCPQDPWAVVRVKLRDGSVLRGFARGEGKHDLQLQTFDGKFHLLLEGECQAITREKTPLMPVTQASAEERTNFLAYLARLGGVSAGPDSPIATIPHAEVDRVLKPQPGEWPNFNGVPGANRHSTLDQINTKNAGRLQLQWSYSFTYPGSRSDRWSTMASCSSRDPIRFARSTRDRVREIWCYSRPRKAAGKISGDAAKGANRGAALLCDSVFLSRYRQCAPDLFKSDHRRADV